MLQVDPIDQQDPHKLLHAIISHASQFSADVSELARFEGELNERVAEGRVLIDRAAAMRDQANADAEVDPSELCVLYLDMRRLNASLSLHSFTRLWFDLSATSLERRMIYMPTVADIRQSVAVFEVLALPRFGRARLELYRSPRRNEILSHLNHPVSSPTWPVT